MLFGETKYSYTRLQNDGSKHGNTAIKFMDQGDIQMVKGKGNQGLFIEIYKFSSPLN